VSPKNKGKFGRGKNTEIPETDEFISGVDRILRALKPHALRIGIFFGVVAVIVVSFTVWKWWGQRKSAAATAMYAQAVGLAQALGEARSQCGLVLDHQYPHASPPGASTSIAGAPASIVAAIHGGFIFADYTARQ
jgi:hypothetical protein